MDAELQNWLGAIAAIIATVLLQLAAQLVLARLLAARPQALRPGIERLRDRAALGLATIFILLIGHLMQMVAWALLYLALGELSGPGNAIYFSVASYTTVGAADLELSRAHRTLGALEAGVGTLMFAWSAAILVTLVGVSGRAVATPRDPR